MGRGRVSVEMFVSEAWLELTPLYILFGWQLCRGQSFFSLFLWLASALPGPRAGQVASPFLLKLDALWLSFLLFACVAFVCVWLRSVLGLHLCP